MSTRSLLISSVTALVLMVTTAVAGPYQDAENTIGEAYTDYRAALFHTNQNNKSATESSLSAFRLKWHRALLNWKKTVPPQYADDPQFFTAVEKVGTLADEAASSSAAGDLAKAHNILEGIREVLGELRSRNGIVNFSDRMNSYHAFMEHVLEHAYPSLTQLGEDSAVLAYLAQDLGKHRPKGIDEQAFNQAIKAVDVSVEALRQAVRSGDADAVEKARKGLKGPYSRMFIRFG